MIRHITNAYAQLSYVERMELNPSYDLGTDDYKSSVLPNKLIQQVSRKDATNICLILVGLSQFDRLTIVEQITGYDPAHPTWKDGMLQITSYLQI